MGMPLRRVGRATEPSELNLFGEMKEARVKLAEEEEEEEEGVESEEEEAAATTTEKPLPLGCPFLASPAARGASREVWEVEGNVPLRLGSREARMVALVFSKKQRAHGFEKKHIDREKKRKQKKK
jgi:hypothetical protein